MGRNSGRACAVVSLVQLVLVASIVAGPGCGRTSSPPAAATPESPNAPAAAGEPARDATNKGQAEIASYDERSSAALLATNDAEPLPGGQSPAIQTEAPGDSSTGSKSRSSAPPRAADQLPSDVPKAPVPPPPSPELIAKWAIPETPPLQLVACYDGFGDSLLQALSLAPDGKQFALGGARLTIWTFGEAKPRADLLENLNSDAVERPIRTAVISADGKWLAAGDQRGTVHLASMTDTAQRSVIKAHDGHVTALAFAPDSQRLATTSYSGEIRLWQLADGKAIKSLKAGEREIARLQFVSNDLLAVGGPETALWNIDTDSRVSVLSTGYVSAPALAVSGDGRSLAYADSDGKVELWDIQQQKVAPGPPMGGQGLCFSHDGKYLAGHTIDAIFVFDVARRQVAQVIDTTGSRTAEMKWLPQGHLLLVASVEGRLRLWGTPESAKSIGIQPLELPVVADGDLASRKPFSSAQYEKVVDIRSLPQLPGAKPQTSFVNLVSYEAPVSQEEAAQFYRYVLGRMGWTELPAGEAGYPGVQFGKQGCQLNATFMPAASVAGTTEPASAAASAAGGQATQVNLNFLGNYDSRWLTQHAPLNSKNNYGFFSTTAYRTQADLTELEVALLKALHAQGWTAYTRLNASSLEEPGVRRMSLLQGGSELTLSIGPPADSPNELVVQAGISVKNKSLPVPPDSGWIEFDSATDLVMVANTSMDLDKTIQFYDQAMLSEGWLAREAGRGVKDGKAWLPFIRGGQDVLVRLVTLPDNGTRVLVGEAERSSWQLRPAAQPDTQENKPGIEAADLSLPSGAKNVQYDVDEKQIRFDFEGTPPPALAEQFIQQLAALGWKSDGSGVRSEEYTFVTLARDKQEVELRARLVGTKNSSVIISGDGLLWTKALPTPPVRISYETWLKRHRLPAGLQHLDRFSAEMKDIPAK